ncbi:hypothetical protein GBAR_LOCUS20313, partial [Geodia barretti]
MSTGVASSQLTASTSPLSAASCRSVLPTCTLKMCLKQPYNLQ